HARRQRDAEDRRGRRPVRIAVAERTVRGQQAAEAHGVAGEEVPHAELAPAFWGERRFGRLDEMRVCGCGAHGVTSLGASRAEGPGCSGKNGGPPAAGPAREGPG